MRGAAGPVLLTPRMIGDVNRSRVLQTFCDHGPTTRADLARLAHVPRATIGAIVQGLIDDQLLEELEPVHEVGQVGKPGRPLWFRERAALSVGVSFEPHEVRAALINARGELLTEARLPLETATADDAEVSRVVIEAVGRVLPPDEPVLGIGVGVPGVVDRGGEVLGSSQVPGATGVRLRDDLAATWPVRVVVDNDARAQALGEKWFGDGRNVSTFASVQTGHGLGVGLVLDGVLFRGDDGLGGELGHTCVDPVGPACSCGLRGCWETVATLRWVRARAVELGLPGAAEMDSAGLVALAGTDEHRDASLELLWAYADHLAQGLSTLVHLLGTRALLMHGDVVGGGVQLRDLIERATRERCLPRLRDEVVVHLSGRADEAVLLGAAGLVLSETFALAV